MPPSSGGELRAINIFIDRHEIVEQLEAVLVVDVEGAEARQWAEDNADIGVRVQLPSAFELDWRERLCLPVSQERGFTRLFASGLVPGRAIAVIGWTERDGRPAS